MKRVENKVALVTGAARGIGRACAELLAREGAIVAVADLIDDEGEAVAEGIRKDGGEAMYWHLDVSDEDEVKRVVDDVAEEFGGLDVLVNNAGISGADKPTHELTEEEWDEVQNVNVKGVFFCTKHAIPHLKEEGGGSIVNLSSIYGILGGPDVPPYHASKGAVRLMAKTDALLYAKDGIRVNSVHPGYIWTPMVEDHLSRMEGDMEELKQQMADLHPVGHMGEPEDIGWAVVYLASDESKFVTGEELVVDGGYTAR